MGLRAEIEADLAETLEDSDDYGMPVILTDPDGKIYAAVFGRVIYDTIAQDENGLPIIDNNPACILRRTSLERIPLPDEKWIVEIPLDPTVGAATQKFLLERAELHGRSIGYVSLHLRRTEQSE